jgi:predicted phosphoribosyltransferase
MFRNREDAGSQLAQRLKGREFHDPLVLAIPRGGVVIGACLARELGAELDVIIARKLRHPHQMELAIGAISETGEMHLNKHGEEVADQLADYLVEECRHQCTEITHRMDLFRAFRPAAPIAGRSVIVTDDGIATGATMIAALKAIKTQHPHEIIVAVPVANPEELKTIGEWCGEVVCLLSPLRFHAVGQFYRDFAPVEDDQVVKLVRSFTPHPATVAAGAVHQ